MKKVCHCGALDEGRQHDWGVDVYIGAEPRRIKLISENTGKRKWRYIADRAWQQLATMGK